MCGKVWSIGAWSGRTWLKMVSSGGLYEHGSGTWCSIKAMTHLTSFVAAFFQIRSSKAELIHLPYRCKKLLFVTGTDTFR
jgi:hypothetical protein